MNASAARTPETTPGGSRCGVAAHPMRYRPGGTLRHGAGASPPGANARTVASISSCGIASTHAKRRDNAYGFSIDDLAADSTPRASNRDPLDLLCVRVRTVLTGVFNAFSKVQPLLSRLKTM